MPFYTIVPSSRRNMHSNPFSPALFGPHGYGPRHSSCAPLSNPASLVPSLFKNLDSDFSSSLDSFFNDLLSPHQPSPAIRSYQPRFDVREEADAFHLTGDLPGVEAGNIAIEFVDRDTMVVKGRTVRESKRGNAPADTTTITTETEKAVEGTQAQTTATATEGETMESEPTTATTSRPTTPNSTHSSASNYHKASVEDGRDEDAGDDFVDVAAEDSNENTTAPAAAVAKETSSAPVNAPASSSRPEATTTAAAPTQQQQPSKPANEQQSRYWVSERSVGEFSRSFRFPGGQADRDNVTASLKDGVLKVVVPKIKQQGTRRIRVE